MKKTFLLIAALLIAVSASAQVRPGTGGGSGGGGATGGLTDEELRATPVAVTCGDCSGSGVAHIDDAAFTAATDDVAPIGAKFDDTSPDSVDENDAGIVRMSANRNLYSTIRDAGGNERGASVTANNELLVELGAGSAVVGVVNLAIGGTALDVNTGADGAQTLRVTEATDSPIAVSLAIIDNMVFGAGTEAAALRVTLPTDGTGVVGVTGAALTALQLIDNPVGSPTGGTAATASFLAGGIYNSTPPTLTNGQQAGLQFTSAGALITSTTMTLDDQESDDNSVAYSSTMPTRINLNYCDTGSVWARCPVAAGGAGNMGSTVTRMVTSTDDTNLGPCTPDPYIAAGSASNEHEIKATAGRLCGFYAWNISEAAAYLRCPNATAASTTPGTTAPLVEMMIPSATDLPGGFTGFIPQSATFSTALTCIIVTEAARTGTTAVAANEAGYTAFYK